MTVRNLEDYSIDTFADIRDENIGNNEEIRKALLERGIVPEDLLPEEDTDRIMRRFSAGDRQETLE